MNDVIVVGAGASGMMAAIMAARAGAHVLLLEHTDTLGKKILSTGNGKCNYTNMEQGGACYRGGDPAFVLPALSSFSPSDTIDFFECLGILPKNRDGYLYPSCGQASSVRDALVLELLRRGVNIKKNVGIRGITYRTDEGNVYFELNTKEGIYKGRTCILACGGKAAKKTGSDGSGYLYAKQLGHTVTEIYPALTALVTEKTPIQTKASGVRCRGRVSLLVDGAKIASDTGELQITDYGVSGIPVFQISRYASMALGQRKAVSVQLDFMPDYEQEQLKTMLYARFLRCKEESVIETLVGLQNSKLILALLDLCHISGERKCRGISTKALAKKLAEVLKKTGLPVLDVKSFDFAQVCAGGVEVSGVCSETMESKQVPGLFFAGEMLDVDGICGGYNLQWAWSSGYLAGSCAAKTAKRKT